MSPQQPTNVAAHSNPPAAHSKTPLRLLMAVLVLQGFTLLAVLGQGPVLPQAGAEVNWQSHRQEQVIPNAAEQRRQQIKLLGAIADQQADTNRRLESLQRAIRDGEIRVRIVED